MWSRRCLSHTKRFRFASASYSTIDSVSVLKSRGLVQDCTDFAGLTEALRSKPSSAVYVGFDPTADSLHVGNLLSILSLKHFQNAGHPVIALVGGATGCIGDPSGRSSERKMLSSEELERNVLGITDVLQKFLDFDSDAPAKVVNNMDWVGDMSAIELIRDVGSHFRISSMLAKDSVKSRLDSFQGLSFTEFSYQIFQAFDFYHLHKNENCVLQLGGSDQWGNIVAGVELIRKKTGTADANDNVKPAYGLTIPLLMTPSGEKFGKSAGNAVWLSSDKTSPFDFYQYFLNVDDESAGKYLAMLTFLPVDEITQIVAEHQSNLGSRIAQKLLAEELTRMVHGEEKANAIVNGSATLFGSNETKKLMKHDFSNFPVTEMSRDSVVGQTVVDIVVQLGLCGTKGEAKRMISGGGIRVNCEKVESSTACIGPEDIGEGCVDIRLGKKRVHVIKVTSS